MRTGCLLSVFILLGVLLVGSGCSGTDGEKPPGTELGKCRPDGTCNLGLICGSGICIRLPDFGIAQDGAQPDINLDASAPDTTFDIGQDLEPTDAPVPDSAPDFRPHSRKSIWCPISLPRPIKTDVGSISRLAA